MFLHRNPQLAELLRVRQNNGGGDIGGANETNSTTTQDQGNDDRGGGTPNYTAAIVVAIVAVVLTVAIFGWVGFRRWQRTRTPKYSRSGRDDNDHSETGPATTETRPVGGTATTSQAAGTVDRNTSVRSVMTLPPYRPRALEGESVLGREGERDGIDVVIELPSAEADEALREEEMETLYQIRLARRRHQQEREERRNARQDARARGDRTALEALRNQSRTATTSNPHELERLRTEHARAQEQRQRAISSVNYADLGVARHDGTRIRANSSESERVGLLSDAASIGASGRSQSALSQNSPRPDAHQRDHSASSAQSINTTQSDDQAQGQQLQGPTQGSQSRAGSVGRAGSSPELIDPAEADMGERDLPLYSPPGYDEVSLNDLTPQQSRSESPYPEPPPDYSAASGPTEARNRRLSARFTDLAAEISSAAPASAAPATVSAAPAAIASASPTPAAPAPAAPAPAALDVAGGSATQSSSTDSQGNRRSSQQVAIPQLPSLRLARLPQIVIEPSSAVPGEHDE